MNSSDQNRDVESTRNEAVRISRWLVAPVVPATPAKKIQVKGWPSLTPAASRESKALKAFVKGRLNIAVVLGKGLVTIDIDDDEFHSELLASTPWLRETLFSTGSGIGGNYWLRIKGSYPRSTKIRYSKANAAELTEVGEFRADRCCTIISGYHGVACREYTNNGKQPLTIPFDKIKWPKGTSPFNPEITQGGQFTERTEGYRDDTEDVSIGPAFAIDSVEAAVAITIPTRPHSTDLRMFRFCQALKNFELHRGNVLSTEELDSAFESWYVAAKPNLQSQSRSRYKLEFLHRFERAKIPLGAAGLLTRAVSKAECSAGPSEIELFEDDPVLQKLISILFYLQVEAGDNAFWISTRDCGQVLGVSHSQAAIWLRTLASPYFGILKLVQAGTSTRCPRYRYIGVTKETATKAES